MTNAPRGAHTDPIVRPTDSATLVVVRTPPVGGPLEAILLERSGKSAFMGGAFVFPGGKLDRADESAEMRSFVSPETLAWCRAQFDEAPERSLSAERAFGLFVAACRETFEEAGILFASAPAGRFPDARVLAPWRRRLQEGHATFAELLRAFDLEADVRRLFSWSHWITPSAERRRYDTRFFVAHLPDAQEAALDDKEAVALRWMTPDEALQAHRRGEVFLPPPTERTLQELAPYRFWADLAAYARARKPSPVLPKVLWGAGTATIVLPWDADYDAVEGEGLRARENPRPDLPTRIRLGAPA